MITMRPGQTVAPTFRPRGYQLSESKKFQNSRKSWLTRNLVARQLNQGSNSWMIDSQRIAEKMRTMVETEHINIKIVILMAGFHRITEDSPDIQMDIQLKSSITFILIYRKLSMETDSQPPFIPIEAVAHLYSRWDCQLMNKNHEGVYFKCMEGQGSVQMANGNLYEGNFHNGMFQGQGSFEWKTGIKYSGSFDKNKLSGKGKFLWPDGSSYQGEVCNGYRSGKGKFINVAQKYCYQGSWKKGLKEGNGKVVYNEGKSYYEGEFKNDMRWGKGKMIYESQNQFEGEWESNKKQGTGTMNWLNAHEKYCGEWKNDLPDGYGEYFWYENKVEFKIVKNIYKGFWKEGKRNGLGAFLYSNGCRFEGIFVNNSKEGTGILFDEYGYSKIEEYKQDKPVSILKRSFKRLQKEESEQAFEPLRKIGDSGKLPKIGRPNPLLKGDRIAENQDNEIWISNHPIKNQYKQYIDFSHAQINQNFYNFLLRLNSRFRSIYKMMCLSSSEVKDFYSGMTLQNYWKFLRDSKLISDSVSLVKISREFSRGSRSQYDLEPPNPKIFQILINDFRLYEGQFEKQKIFWKKHFSDIKQLRINWHELKVLEVSDLERNKKRDINASSKIILFRHFVCLIIHTALLSIAQPQALKDKVEQVLANFELCGEGLKQSKDKNVDNQTQFSHPKAIIVPEWSKAVQKELIAAISPAVGDLFGKVEVFVPVRVIYCVIEAAGDFKDVGQKFQSLERMQRYLNIKVSALKKEWKSYFQDLQKVLKVSPFFDYLMNYEMNEKEIHEFLFVNLNRKAVASTHEDFKSKYSGLLSQINTKILQNIAEVRKTFSRPLKRKHVVTRKDQHKLEMIKLAEEQKQRLAEQNRKKEEEARERLEILKMGREDHDVEDFSVSSHRSSEYFSE